ncbi:AraC family transcriptional regulator [Aquimarina spongiae]|uniref:Transcriptional regulator, AraC family n=1 Tax=Aquimarina spongiae TaxID=570521 RepID=A0A1M6GPB7_9FLAO|nr:helix-turn-helix domain-containing protein [Aquimarina spongiae]SHJ11783.1 transcriptional regulator, AraC family [Aquimarina spongiae]
MYLNIIVSGAKLDFDPIVLKKSLIVLNITSNGQKSLPIFALHRIMNFGSLSMKVYLKYDMNVIFKKTLEQQLDQLKIDYKINGVGEVEFLHALSIDKIKELTTLLSVYGIQIINDHKTEVVQRIKDTVSEMVLDISSEKNHKISTYLPEKLGYSYTYLSSLFSESTYTSIENFLIIKRIDRVKQMLIQDHFTLKQIAFELGYSSTAHLSAQFKKVTGLTPTSFQKIITKRSEFTETPKKS